MKTLMHLLVVPVAMLALVAFRPVAGKLVTKAGHINFFSHTAVEDITANNYKVVSTIETSTGAVAFSVPMQSFEFEKALMQEHFNNKDFLNTKDFPKAKFEGQITNINAINFNHDGTHEVTISGNLTIKDVTRPLSEKGTLTVKGDVVNGKTKFKLVLADYGITFKKGKPSTNIGKEIEVTLNADYQSE
jgi:polyisoprenoid-binding protein YceI